MPFRIIGYDGASYRSQILEKNKKIVPDDKREIQHVDAVLKLLSVMTKDDSYREILYDEDGNKAEVKTMCEVAERLKNEGKNAGRIEGRIEGIECERMRAIKKKMDKNKSKETIADELELSVEEVEKYIELIKNDKCDS